MCSSDLGCGVTLARGNFPIQQARRHTREGGYPVRREFAVPSLTPRNTGSPPSRGRRSNMTSRSRDIIRPSFTNSFALKNRGRREDRVRAAPAVPCAKVANKNAHEHTGSAEAVRPSLRNGLRLIPCSPRRDHSLLVTVAPRKREIPRNLTPAIGASGPHDFAVRFSHARQSQLSRPSLPAPNVRDDRETPLLVGAGWREISS